jgi:hypothetical protein
MKIVATWSGECFTMAHVLALKRQLDVHAPLDDFVCITPVKIPGVECWQPTHQWPGWWHKYEVFAPHIRGTVLYMDIDTVIIGSLGDLLKVDKLTLLRDFYRDGKRLKEGLQASLMLLPEADRAEIWEDWMRDPAAHMQRLGRKGDQPMLEEHYMARAQKWQDVAPGQIVSWKVNCGGGNAFSKPVIPADARLIVFHGQPRPWDCSEFKELYA